LLNVGVKRNDNPSIDPYNGIALIIKRIKKKYGAITVITNTFPAA
jgi:hypothetical protein